MMTPRRMTDELEARLNGPHSEDHTVQAAFLTAEAVRFLVYATGSHAAAGLPYPGTAYQVTGSLKIAADRLPQLFDQLKEQMNRDLNGGLLGIDTTNPDALLAAVADYDRHLAAAATLAAQLADTISAAQSAITWVNGRGPNRQTEAL